MVVITFDGDNDFDMSIAECDSYRTQKDEEDIGNIDITFEGCKVYIDHNASMGMSGTFVYHRKWEMYADENVVITEYKTLNEGRRAFFNMLINEGYGGDERNFINDFFNIYPDGNLELLEWILEYVK